MGCLFFKISNSWPPHIPSDAMSQSLGGQGVILVQMVHYDFLNSNPWPFCCQDSYRDANVMLFSSLVQWFHDLHPLSDVPRILGVCNQTNWVKLCRDESDTHTGLCISGLEQTAEKNNKDFWCHVLLKYWVWNPRNNY